MTKYTKCTVLHLDMDAFFAAIEQRDRPELKGRPVIIGARPDQRGVVSTASYEARRYGVHSALPSRTAFKRCPHGVFLPVRMQRYQEASQAVMQILHSFTPIVEPVSIDEAFMDVSSVLKRWGDPVTLAGHIKKKIKAELQLTASVGVAPNKFLAKLASDYRKPDGLTVVPSEPEQICRFLAPLPVSRIWGIGKVTEKELARHGIKTIGQIQALTLIDAVALLGPSFGHHIWTLARGKDEREVIAEPQVEKSISNEATFPEDCSDQEVVKQTLIELTEKVGRRMRAADRVARVGQIKIRFSDFRTITRQRSFQKPVNTDRQLLRCALELYEQEHICSAIRLIGFGASDLSLPGAEQQQPLLFADLDTDNQEIELDSVVDALRKQYGVDILKRGNWEK